jgi:hypothetical protein
MQWTAPHPRRRPYPGEIEDGKHKIAELDPQIANLTNQIEELTKLRHSLEQERRNCQSFIAPFNRMPTEILCEIAWHAVGQETSPSLLNQICAPMRDAVNGFKAFWNHIYIKRWSSPKANKVRFQSAFFLSELCSERNHMQLCTMATSAAGASVPCFPVYPNRRTSF